MTTTTELAPYDVRDPHQLMSAISAQCTLVGGSAHLALVKDVSTEQQVLRVDRLSLPAEILDWDGPRRELRRVMDGWSVPREPGPPRHMPVLVVVRSGLCVFGANEGQWLMASRYANPMVPVWPMELILVTEHGWLDFMTNEAGSEPALAPWAT